MGMADDIRVMGVLLSGDVALDDAFSEWDENAPIAQLARGSQPHVLPPRWRTITLPEPAPTSRLANATRRSHPTTLEEALLALTNGVPELIPSDC
jgi:hypothetical protein